jgi:hypothetical protein
VRVLVERGRTYAAFVNGGTQAELVLDLPRGDYQCEWMHTRTGRIEKNEYIQQAGELRTLKSPSYSEDIVLRVVRQSARSKE